jgi:hypothetical protein
MTEDELRTEQQSIEREHAYLEFAYAALQRNPYDAQGHAEHMRRLRSHILRLRAVIAAMRQTRE